MPTMRRFARVIAIFWMVAVVAIGVGGTYASRNQAEIAEGALSLAGVDVDGIEAGQRDKQAERDAKLRRAQYSGGGWGEQSVPGQDDTSDWGD